mmetsp:Transcript_43032/g.168437  ORF Transcript_43032/g.168437 Transcript_43032/m.168437 type:complete len:402 (-) Transcript_43032:904-2109(-)|eukprot:CAMPEP_0113961200 /NCGR_PEP_ID=MMETSP0011_2-20120614/5166_1 /TAXON_ID=101924 /ORGANISM="Rhodosorus marinus" /LENGTH=401 /DNA_ID=CAMNT_0000972793 /DNA_START=261 /DNA_END=1466 /DNA_ORIENTATION=- /assembly_acc=CAM_ASM_000156
MSAATYRRPVVIIGAGLTGLVTAVSMQRAGLTPLIFEKKPHLPHAKTGVALWGNGMRVIDRLGVGTKLRTCGLTTLSSEIVNSTDGRVLCKLNFSEESSGHVNEILVAELNELKQLLLEELPSESVVFNKELDSFTQHGDYVDVHLADGSNVEGAVLIGADGLYSRVRSRLKLQMSHRYAGYSTWRGVTNVTNLSKEFPLQLGREIWGKGRRFGAMHMRTGTLYWYAVAAAGNGEVFLRPFKKTLLNKFGDWNFRCGEVIDATDERNITRHDVQERLQPVPWVENRVVLMGEAAHPITENMHLSTCLAVEDGHCLAQMLAEYGVRDPLGLEMYERTRKPRCLAVAQRSRRIERIAQFEHPLTRWLTERVLGRRRLATALRHILRIIPDYTAGDLPGPILRS